MPRGSSVVRRLGYPTSCQFRNKSVDQSFGVGQRSQILQVRGSTASFQFAKQVNLPAGTESRFQLGEIDAITLHSSGSDTPGSNAAVSRLPDRLLSIEPKEEGVVVEEEGAVSNVMVRISFFSKITFHSFRSLSEGKGRYRYREIERFCFYSFGTEE